MGPLWVSKATPHHPLPPSFLPHPFCHTFFTPPKPILGHLMNPSCLGKQQEPWCTPGTASAASLAMPPSFHKPRERGKEGREGEKEDNKLVKEPGTQYCDYSLSGDWGRGSHLVLEGRSDGWRGRWDGFSFLWFGMVLGNGVGEGSRESAWGQE